MRFLTKETWKQSPNDEMMALMPAEIEKATELTKQGVIEATYTADDQSAAWMVWNVDSQAALEETHGTLPLHPYMNSGILTVLAEGM